MTSQKIMYLLTSIYAIVVITYIISWFALGETPSELLRSTTWLYGLTMGGCGCLYAYECKFKS